MNRKVRLAAGLAWVAIACAPAAEAGPFQKFFRKVRHAFTQGSDKPPRHHRTAPRSANHTPPKDSGTTSDTEHPKIAAPPNVENTRTATPLSSNKSLKSPASDIPYGTPVPGKPGFVTSPFAPTSGYVDVRNFPPGTEVRDPFSGRSFLTP